MTEALNFYCVVIGYSVIMMSGQNTRLPNNDELPWNCDYLRQDTNVTHECCMNYGHCHPNNPHYYLYDSDS